MLHRYPGKKSIHRSKETYFRCEIAWHFYGFYAGTPDLTGTGIEIFRDQHVRAMENVTGEKLSPFVMKVNALFSRKSPADAVLGDSWLSANIGIYSPVNRSISTKDSRASRKGSRFCVANAQGRLDSRAGGAITTDNLGSGSRDTTGGSVGDTPSAGVGASAGIVRPARWRGCSSTLGCGCWSAGQGHLGSICGLGASTIDITAC